MTFMPAPGQPVTPKGSHSSKVANREVNIEQDQAAEEIVLKANNGLRKVPTLEVAGRYFACSPFDPEELALELDLPPNP